MLIIALHSNSCLSFSSTSPAVVLLNHQQRRVYLLFTLKECQSTHHKSRLKFEERQQCEEKIQVPPAALLWRIYNLLSLTWGFHWTHPPLLWETLGPRRLFLGQWEVHLSSRSTMNRSSLPEISWLYLSRNVLRLRVLWGTQDSAVLATGPCWSQHITRQ